MAFRLGLNCVQSSTKPWIQRDKMEQASLVYSCPLLVYWHPYLCCQSKPSLIVSILHVLMRHNNEFNNKNTFYYQNKTPNNTTCIKQQSYRVSLVHKTSTTTFPGDKVNLHLEQFQKFLKGHYPFVLESKLTQLHLPIDRLKQNGTVWYSNQVGAGKFQGKSDSFW